MAYNHKRVTERDVENAYISYLKVKASVDFPGSDEQHRQAIERAWKHMMTLGNQLAAQRTADNSDR